MTKPDKNNPSYWYDKADKIIGSSPEQQICKSVRMRILMQVAAELVNIYEEGMKDGVREYNMGSR